MGSRSRQRQLGKPFQSRTSLVGQVSCRWCKKSVNTTSSMMMMIFVYKSGGMSPVSRDDHIEGRGPKWECRTQILWWNPVPNSSKYGCVPFRHWITVKDSSAACKVPRLIVSPRRCFKALLLPFGAPQCWPALYTNIGNNLSTVLKHAAVLGDFVKPPLARCVRCSLPRSHDGQSLSILLDTTSPMNEYLLVLLGNISDSWQWCIISPYWRICRVLIGTRKKNCKNKNHLFIRK